MIFGRITTAEGKSTRKVAHPQHLCTGLAGQSRHDARLGHWFGMEIVEDDSLGERVAATLPAPDRPCHCFDDIEAP